MRIEYKANRSQRGVRESVGRALISRGLARRVYETRQIAPEQEATEEDHAHVSAEVVDSVPDVEISPRTGKPKRKYKRRDMRAEA